MGENFIVPIMFAVIAASTVFSWLIMRWLRGRWSRLVSIFVAGISPFAFIVLAVGVWHYAEVRAHQLNGSEGGFMGPALILVYGFPYFVILLIVDFAAAASSGRRK